VLTPRLARPVALTIALSAALLALLLAGCGSVDPLDPGATPPLSGAPGADPQQIVAGDGDGDGVADDQDDGADDAADGDRSVGGDGSRLPFEDIAYQATGGVGGLVSSGPICSLTAPFELSNEYGTSTFTPLPDALAGEWSFAGGIGGDVVFAGTGDYVVTGADGFATAIVLNLTGSGEVVGAGGGSETATATWTLLPIGDC
jgi:hypothetical protein